MFFLCRSGFRSQISSALHPESNTSPVNTWKSAPAPIVRATCSHCSCLHRRQFVNAPQVGSMSAHIPEASTHINKQVDVRRIRRFFTLKTTPEESCGSEWTSSKVLHLIREYGNRPALWDPECEDYKNRFRRHHKWMELAAIFKCSKLEVERKMKILNSQFRRERLKAVRMRKLGKAHRVTWYGYKAFGFMCKGEQWVRYKNKANVVDTEVEEVNPIKQEICDSNDDDDGIHSTADLMPLLDEEAPQDTSSSTVVSQINDDTVLQNNYKDNEQTSHENGLIKILYDNKDEWTLFGELVAHAFRKFPDDRTRCIVRHKINTILFEAELATYGSSSTK